MRPRAGKLTFAEMCAFFAATSAAMSDEEFGLIVGEMVDTCEAALKIPAQEGKAAERQKTAAAAEARAAAVAAAAEERAAAAFAAAVATAPAAAAGGACATSALLAAGAAPTLAPKRSGSCSSW